MNQDQRKYLIEQVEETCKQQIEKLEKQIPDRPSLNNYLIASFLDNSVQFADINLLKKKMRDAVLKMGHHDQLIKKEDEYWGRRRKKNDDEDDETEIVAIAAEDLFIIPDAYTKALKEYKIKKEEIERQIDSLRMTEKTIVLKLQIGSASALEKLVMQADNMGDLSLINSRLAIEDKTNSDKREK
jgi:hypothetical protein